LITKGFGYDLNHFLYMSKEEKDSLFNEMKIAPRDKNKLISLIKYISEIMPDLTQNCSQPNNNYI